MHPLFTLLKKDWIAGRNTRRIVSQQSRFKLLFVLGFALMLMAGLGVMFWEGFRFLGALGGMGLMIIRYMFGLFFFSMGVMLVISNIVTAYATVFRSDEIPFLLARPVGHGELMLHKLLETSALSSWAFFMIILPFIGAYAWYERVPLWFTPATLLFSIPFVVLCSGLGLLATLALARWLPRFRPRLWMAGVALVAVVWGIIQVKMQYKQAPDDMTFILTRLLPGLRLANHPLWPSWWVAEGLMALSREQWLRGTLFFAVLTANLLMIGLLVELAGRRIFFAGWLRVLTTTRAERGRRLGVDWIARIFRRLPPDGRAMLSKDVRTLLRDPVQWIQGLLFFGLLGLYFFNLRNLQYDQLSPVWRNLIAFLNMFSLAAVMCSFCSRFVYPQLSLEGQGFWLIGMAPTTMGRVLAVKFGWAVFEMLIISGSLLTISTRMLGGTGAIVGITFLIAAALSLALSGLATGLGAIFLDLRQRNPTAIISGFGGTLNLVLSLAFMVAAILPYGMLYHAHTTDRIGPVFFQLGLGWATAWLVVLTAAATLIPLLAGRRSLVRREY